MRCLFPTIALGLASLVVAQQPRLDSSVRDKIINLIASRGYDGHLPSRITTALEFTDSESELPLQQIGEEESATGATHVFAVVADRSKDLVLMNLKGESAAIYRVLPDGRLLAGVTFVRGAEKPVPLSSKDALLGIKGEYIYWTTAIGSLSDWLYCQGELQGPHPVSEGKKRAACTALIDSGKLSPDDLAEAYLMRSNSYDTTKGEAPKVFADVTRAAQANPTSASAWAQICSASNDIYHDPHSALQYCDKAIALDPNDAQGYTFRGDIHLRQKEYEGAISDYNHAIALYPDWMWPWDNRGEAYLRLGNLNAAEANFGRVIELEPKYTIGYIDRGIVRIKQGKLDAALSDFEASIKVIPTCGGCLVGKGIVERLQGHVAEGDADIAKGKALEPRAAENFTEDGIQVP